MPFATGESNVGWNAEVMPRGRPKTRRKMEPLKLPKETVATIILSPELSRPLVPLRIVSVEVKLLQVD